MALCSVNAVDLHEDKETGYFCEPETFSELCVIPSNRRLFLVMKQPGTQGSTLSTRLVKELA